MHARSCQVPAACAPADALGKHPCCDVADRPDPEVPPALHPEREAREGAVYSTLLRLHPRPLLRRVPQMVVRVVLHRTPGVVTGRRFGVTHWAGLGKQPPSQHRCGERERQHVCSVQDPRRSLRRWDVFSPADLSGGPPRATGTSREEAGFLRSIQVPGLDTSRRANVAFAGRLKLLKRSMSLGLPQLLPVPFPNALETRLRLHDEHEANRFLTRLTYPRVVGSVA